MLSFGSAEESERAFSRGVVGPVQYQGRDAKRYIEELKEKDKDAGELLEFLFSLNLSDSELKGGGNLVDHAEMGKLFGYRKEDILAYARYNILPEYWDKAKFYQAAEIFKEKRPLIRVISEYAVHIGVDIGPGPDKPSLMETSQIYDIITEQLRKENIEILLPQQEFKLTKVMKTTLSSVDSRAASLAGINAKPYDKRSLRNALKAPDTKKIILVTKTTETFVNALLKEDAQVFKDVKILRVNLPNFKEIKDENEKTVHQARIIMIAALSRLLKETKEGAESNVEIVLKHMLTGLVVPLDSLDEDKITLEKFIKELKKTDAENASNKEIQDRLDLFLNKAAICLTEELARDLKFIKLFWTAA